MARDNNGIWIEKYRIHSYEVDRSSRALPHVLLCYMLNSAWAHVNDSRFSFNSLHDDGQFWVLSRFLAVFHQIPRWDDELTIETWGKGIDKLFASRDFVIYSDAREKLISATSAWLIIDRKTLRPLRMETLKEQFPFQSERHELENKLEKIRARSVPGTNTEFKVRYSDLDVNQHVNSSKYMQWILDSFPVEILEGKNIKSFEINYLAEAQLDDRISVFIGPDAEQYYCVITRADDKTELCKAIVTWSGPEA